MDTNAIMQYYDDLMRLAVSKCNAQADAEDLVGDTLLAAFSYINNGGRIEYPKTWLANTLYHKYHESLRKKYRMPITVNFDDALDIPTEVETDFSSDDAAKVRKELTHLGFITREVLIRYYFGKQSVSDIATGLGIPKGTVKSRLSAGRSQMKKGLETMEPKENHLPGKLYLSNMGTTSPDKKPEMLVEDDLIAQNLLILAYEKPLSISDLSKAIGIPAAYIEPIIKKLVDGELMAETSSGKVYTDFIMTTPQDQLRTLTPQLDFVHKHFDTIWKIIAQMSDQIRNAAFASAMNFKQKTELDRYAILKALQNFQQSGIKNFSMPIFPNRKDGGRWFVHATAIPAEYHMRTYTDSTNYLIIGGHRVSEDLVDDGKRSVRFCEFDTTLLDNPHRYAGMHDLYFRYIVQLLWKIYKNIPFAADETVPNELISHIPTLEDVGILTDQSGALRVDIPILMETEYTELNATIKRTVEALKAAIGNNFSAFAHSMKTPIPKHLTSVPELFRYNAATNYFAMAVVRTAYEKGLHLKNLSGCYPPVVLVYREAK